MTVKELITTLLDLDLNEEIGINLTVFDKNGNRNPDLRFEIDKDSICNDGMGNTAISIYADEDEDFNF